MKQGLTPIERIKCAYLHHVRGLEVEDIAIVFETSPEHVEKACTLVFDAVTVPYVPQMRIPTKGHASIYEVSNTDMIVKAMQERGEPMRQMELCALLAKAGRGKNSASSTLCKMIKTGQVIRKDIGLYALGVNYGQ